MPSVTIDGKGGHELKLEKKMGQFFLVLTPCLQKLPKKTMARAEIWWHLILLKMKYINEICLISSS